MFLLLPIGDEPNNHVRRPFVTWGLLATNLLVMLLAPRGGGEEAQKAFYERWAYFAADGVSPGLVTHLFIHDLGSWMHVLGNMLFLWIFGDNVESRLGHVPYLLAYLLVGVAAALVQGLLASDALPLIGASGAISGVQGLYFVACPGARVRLVVLILYIVNVVMVPARLVMLLWFGLQDLLPIVLPKLFQHDNVGHGAHLGGFAAGVLLMLALVPFFGRGEPPPPAPRVMRYRRRTTPWE